jgi:hypothetical protein
MIDNTIFLIFTIAVAGFSGGWITIKICGPYGRNSSYENNKLALYMATIAFFGVQFIIAKIIGAPTIYSVICALF